MDFKKDRPTAYELGTAIEKQLSHFYRMKQEWWFACSDPNYNKAM